MAHLCCCKARMIFILGTLLENRLGVIFRAVTVVFNPEIPGCFRIGINGGPSEPEKLRILKKTQVVSNKNTEITGGNLPTKLPFYTIVGKVIVTFG